MKRIFHIFIFLFLFLVVCPSLIFVSIRHHSAKLYSEACDIKPLDVIIVPGVPVGIESAVHAMTVRIFWAKYLFDNGYTRNIIFSGSAVHSPYVEGIAMKMIADSLGIPRDHTFSETQAEHSTENVWYGWRMARGMGFQKIAVATEAFQSLALENFIETYCPEMISLPVVPTALQLGDQELPKMDLARAFKKDFISLSERENLWQRIQGTLGRRVREEVERESIPSAPLP